MTKKQNGNQDQGKNKELLLEIQYNCNLRCIHCSSINCPGKIKVEDISKMVNLDEIQTVRLSGGEPMLDRNLDEYIKFFYDRGIRIIVQTNGTKTFSSILGNYIITYADEVWFSFYGNETVHNFITMGNNFHMTMGSILSCSDNIDVTIQSPIFNETQLASLLHEIHQMDEGWNIAKRGVKLRLFTLLNHGRCNFALSGKEQMDIYNSLLYRYKKTEITCSLDTSKCNYDNKLVLKPNGSLFNCASHKHNMQLCQK